MVDIIQLLPYTVANLLAAGEAVQCLSSVTIELL